MTEIAHVSGLAPASLYTYFGNKEAVLLAVLAEDLDRWLGGLANALDATQQPSAEDIANLIARSAADEPTLAPLLVALSSDIEVAADPNDLAALKRRGNEHVVSVASALERALPGVDGEAAMRYLRALMIGLWSFATPPDPTRSSRQKRANAQRWYGEELTRAVTAMLRGLRTELRE